VIPPRKLARLHPKQRVRKAAILFQDAERGMRLPDASAARLAADYALALAAYLAADAELPEAVRASAASAAELPGTGQGGPDAALLRAVNLLRHLLLRESGQAPADWDLLDPASGRPDPAARRPIPGLRAYLEDIRSPFNVGSMLRSADAFGLEELVLSPDCADPGHPRAARSAMGAAGLVPWRRSGLEVLAEAARAGEAVFALELGGVDLGDFSFPPRGIAVIGSEELGVSAEALALCGAGKVSIPMRGAKASLNVGVAFGILLHAWSESLST
jgi:TrmH family RNA methyltransferase